MSGCDIASDITRNLSNPSVCTLEHCVLEANMHMFKIYLLTIHVLICHLTKFISSQGNVIDSLSATIVLATYRTKIAHNIKM